MPMSWRDRGRTRDRFIVNSIIRVRDILGSADWFLLAAQEHVFAVVLGTKDGG